MSHQPKLPLLLGLPVAASIALLELLRFSLLLNIPGKGLSHQTALANYAMFALRRQS